MNMSTGYYPYGDYHRGGAAAGAQAETSMMDSSYGPASMMSSLSYSHSYAQYPSQGATTAAAHRTQVYTPSGGHHQQPSFYSQRDFSDSRCFVVSIILIIIKHILLLISTITYRFTIHIHIPSIIICYQLISPVALTSARLLFYVQREIPAIERQHSIHQNIQLILSFCFSWLYRSFA